MITSESRSFFNRAYSTIEESILNSHSEDRPSYSELYENKDMDMLTKSSKDAHFHSLVDLSASEDSVR